MTTTPFENHLLYFADNDGYLTYTSLVEGMEKIKLKSAFECKVIALAVLWRFRHLAQGICKIPVEDIIRGKHPASTNVWNNHGQFDEQQFEFIKQHMDSFGLLHDDAIQRMLDTCQERDSGCPFSKAKIADGRDFGNTSWSFLQLLMTKYGHMNEQNLRQFFTDASVIYDSIAQNS